MLSWGYYYELEQGGVDEQIGQIMEVGHVIAPTSIKLTTCIGYCSSLLYLKYQKMANIGS